MNTFYFHEDDHLQAQLVPASAISPSATEHERFELIVFPMPEWDGNQWQPVFVHRDHAQLYRLLGITLDRLGATIDKQLARFDAVQTGYSTHREQCERTVAWGDDAGSALLAEWSTPGIVENLWLLDRITTEASLQRWLAAIDSLQSLVPLYIVDDSRWFVVNCANRAALREALFGDLDPPMAAN